MSNKISDIEACIRRRRLGFDVLQEFIDGNNSITIESKYIPYKGYIKIQHTISDKIIGIQLFDPQNEEISEVFKSIKVANKFVKCINFKGNKKWYLPDLSRDTSEYKFIKLKDGFVQCSHPKGNEIWHLPDLSKHTESCINSIKLEDGFVQCSYFSGNKKWYLPDLSKCTEEFTLIELEGDEIICEYNTLRRTIRAKYDLNLNMIT